MYPIELARATWLLFRMRLGAILGSRKTLVGLVLASAPPLIGFLMAKLAPGDVSGGEMFGALGAFFLILVVVPMLGVSLGVGVVADEAEARTITYPFTRPVPRAALFLGRWLATMVSLVVLVGASGGLLFLATSVRDEPPTGQLGLELVGAAVMGVVVYSIGSAVIGVLAKRGLVIALGYAFAFEILLSNLPGSSRNLTVQHHLRSTFIDPSDPAWAEFEPIARVEFMDADVAMLKLVAIAAVLLVLGCVAVTRKQFVLSS